MRWLLIVVGWLCAGAALAAEPVVFQARTARSGNWSDAATWENGRLPAAGNFVQVRNGNRVVYDVDSADPLRMIHVAGTLSFSRDKSTLLVVGLIKIEAGETATEDGFDCSEAAVADHAHHQHGPAERPALEIGTREQPIPATVQATIRLHYFPGTNPETLPAIVCCGGRWDVHGAPLAQTWLKLAEPAKVGDTQIRVLNPVSDWRVGDRIIITTGEPQGGPISGHSYQKRPFAKQKPVGTEERTIAKVADDTLTLNTPLARPHRAQDGMRCEVANLSRNVVIESANPGGVRGHTMYHHGSAGGISYAEFRHLGKDGVLGKYAIHFHLVGDSMRGSGVTGASIWDSHNRWITVHGTDYLLIRDCVGYQSRGHGYYLEDATEQWNLLDRNLAVQAFGAVPLPKQVLPYDLNDGAGFWWANGRNGLTRNVACENDRYGYHFQIAETPEFDPRVPLRQAGRQATQQDVRTIPFWRFERNESHGAGLFDFRFGAEDPGAVRGDRTHPFIAKDLLCWESHYAIRPNVDYFLLQGFRAQRAAFGIYHPEYGEHVYRDIELQQITGEPLNGGHDETSLPRGNVTFDGLTLVDCALAKDPLIQLTEIGTKPGLAGHFRGLALRNSRAANGGIVDFGGGPRTERVEHPVQYFFHDAPTAGSVTQVSSQRLLALNSAATDYQPIANWTGPAARGKTVTGVPFPELLAPVDDLPPATMITRIERVSGKVRVRGVSHDNGEVRRITVNGQAATIVSQQAGVADWTITLEPAASYSAQAEDVAGNAETAPHELRIAMH